MQRIEIPKGNGKTRTIWVPSREEKEVATNILYRLESIYSPQNCVHGFTTGRSPVTNALAHAGEWRFTMSMDIADFFDNVRVDEIAGFKRLRDVIDTENRSHSVLNHLDEKHTLAFPGGVAVQGLPCSPIIANMAMDEADTRILNLRKKNRLGYNFVYTRYADDLTFSFNHPKVGKDLESIVPQIISDYGFWLNEAKTHWQESSRGARIITGISINNSSKSLPRKVKRQIRAAEHQSKVGMNQKTRLRFGGEKRRLEQHLKGRLEWSKLKTPKAWEIRNNEHQTRRSFGHTGMNTMPNLKADGNLRAINA